MAVQYALPAERGRSLDGFVRSLLLGRRPKRFRAQSTGRRPLPSSGPTKRAPAYIRRAESLSLLVRSWASRGGLRAVPVFELRSGFPYSTVNQNRDIVGARNRAGRFPVYKALGPSGDESDSRFRWPARKRHFRAGIRFFNLLKHLQPHRTSQSNLASPYFGTFYRGVKRKLRAVFELGKLAKRQDWGRGRGFQRAACTLRPLRSSEKPSWMTLTLMFREWGVPHRHPPVS